MFKKLLPFTVVLLFGCGSQPPHSKVKTRNSIIDSIYHLEILDTNRLIINSDTITIDNSEAYYYEG